MPLIYLVAGEASGDALGAGLMSALRSLRPGTPFAGIGGAAMQHEGLASLFPYEELSVMGFWEVLPHIPKFLKLLRATADDIAQKKPDVVVTIDSPGFNFRLAKMLKDNPETRTIKRVHYVAPSVWAYKPQRARKTAELFDMLLALLPFEPQCFEKEGLKTVFTGHPALWQPPQGNGAGFRNLHGIAAGEKLLLVLPGSRKGEVMHHLPIFISAAKSLSDYRIVILAGPQVKEFIRKAVPSDIIVCDFAEKYDAFAAADMALSKSGTVTLELAAHHVPMIVAHRVSAISAWLIRRMLLIKYASLVNIAVDKEIVPELMQERCTAAEIKTALEQLANPEEMQKQRADVAKAIQILHGGNPRNPSLIAVEEILKLKTS